MNLFYQPQIPEGLHFLNADESRHCVKVLRHNNGDQITITDGKGKFYQCIIIDANAQKCSFNIKEESAAPVKDYSIHIAISPTKNADRTEWFVEKTVELGIDEITLIECENTERTFINIERLNKVAVSAMKQSLKAVLPVIKGLTNFEDVVGDSQELSKFIAHVDTNNPIHLKDNVSATSSYVVLIGPEGDFSPMEISFATSNGFQKVSLGESRLRTETAGIAACHILNLLNT